MGRTDFVPSNDIVSYSFSSKDIISVKKNLSYNGSNICGRYGLRSLLSKRQSNTFFVRRSSDIFLKPKGVTFFRVRLFRNF